MDFNIELDRGTRLHGMILSPGDKARGVLVLVHGLGEHTRRYEAWAELFRSEGFAFTGVDLPGHGLSSGRRGHVRSYKVLDRMIGMMLTSCSNTFPDIPVFLYGHSLGGGFVLNYLLRFNPPIKGAIVTSPWLQLTFEPPRAKVVLASLMKNLVPGLVQPSGLNINHLSHDPEAVRRYRTDPLIHDRISVSLFDGVVKAARYTMSHPGDLSIPVLLIHGGEDMITSADASRDFAGKTAFCNFRLWEGGYHELQNETFSEEVFRYIIGWLNEQLAK